MSEKLPITDIAWCPLDDDSYGLMYKREGDLKWHKAEIIENEQVKSLFEEEACACGLDWDKIHKTAGGFLIGVLIFAIGVVALW